MSMAALRWVRAVRVAPTQKLVLWALADHANSDGEAWPSIAGLIEATCLSERGIQKALSDLRAAGVIEAIQGGGRSRTTVYRLLIETPQDVQGFEERNPAPRALNGARGALKGAPRAPNPARRAPKPSITFKNPQEPSTRARASSPGMEVALPEWLPADAWAEWCAYRRGRRWTQKAAEYSLRELRKLHEAGDDPRAVIEQSIGSGWTGLFALKNRPREPQQRESTIAWILDDRNFGGMG